MTATNYSVPPGHYLQEWLTENEMTIGEAMHVLDIEPDVVLDLLNGNTELGASHAKQLAELTSIPTDSWLRYETQYQADMKRLAETTSPMPSNEPPTLDDHPALDHLADAITYRTQP